MFKNLLKHSLLYLFLFGLFTLFSFSQNKIEVKAHFDIEKGLVKISQTIQYQNETNDKLQTIYLNDWSNSYATKTTPLAKRMAEEYKNEFHLAKNVDRGYSVITSIKQNRQDLIFQQLKNQNDIIKVELNAPLQPHNSYTIQLEYLVRIPNDKFTRYGITPNGDLNLRYWLISPAIYNGKWQYFSNKDLNDMYVPASDIVMELTYPNNYHLTSELDLVNSETTGSLKSITLKGKNRIHDKLFLSKKPSFERMNTRDFTIFSNIDDENIEVLEKALILGRISKYVQENLGDYPHDKLLLSQIDYDKNPIYGLNILPKFLKPYPNHFNYELKLVKIILHNYLENTLLLNPRKEQWLLDGIEIFFLMNYVEEYYPDMKFLGDIANIWGVRSFHAADMAYNDKYNLAYMLMARTNRDQPLTMAKDSLLKFNTNIANKYKAGIGLNYLDDFINSNHTVEQIIEAFLKENKLQPTSTKDFEAFVKSKTHKDIDWFFSDYLSTRKIIDYKIKNVSKTEDSITLTVKNKHNTSMPVSLYALNNDSIISKTWIENISKYKTLTIPRNNANKLVLNYENIIPEYNVRDNWKSLKGVFFNNKPLQFRLFKDIEDPYYNQVFFMPIVEFNNIYDGFTLGVNTYNKTVLRKLFNYKIKPVYAFKSRSLTGSAAISKTHYFRNSNFFYLNYGITGSYSSFADDLFVRQLTPSVTLIFREDNDLRANKRQMLMFRYVDIHRDKDETNRFTSNEPNYGVFNARYLFSNDNLIDFSKWYTDFQIAQNFTKLSFNYEYRHLFENNRQLNLRFFAGTFISNKNDPNSDYFSFALDRPTDYLFEYPYLGRSEDSGIFSQQYIEAEGGFKSKLDTPFANQWITTMNTSTTLWKYILVYGDLGLVKNKFDNPHFVYDSGIRVNLVTDYFEIYLPVYSNLGWEIAQPKYDQKIRFKFTVDPQVLLGLFRRRWF